MLNARGMLKLAERQENGNAVTIIPYAECRELMIAKSLENDDLSHKNSPLSHQL